jgi:magnesium-transporting ATPase (P-type)
MITGDQRLTAQAIGRDLGLFHDHAEMLDSRDVARLSKA